VLLYQSVQLIKVLLLNLNTATIPLPHQFCILSVLNQKVAAPFAMIIRTNEDGRLSASFEQSLLKCLLPNVMPILPQVFVQGCPRLSVMSSDTILE